MFTERRLGINSLPDECQQVMDRPVHDLLASTCYGHIGGYFGEIEAVKRQLRS